MYIYIITNLVNNKKYVGQTAQEPLKRWKDHKSMNKPDKVLYKAFIKYGIENFKFEIIEQCLSSDELIEAEIKWISHYDTFLGEGYNMTSGGEGCGGWEHTDETKQKLSKSLLGIKRSEETKKKMSDYWKSDKNHLRGRLGKLNHNSKKITQHDRSTNLIIKTWDSIADVERELNIANQNITKCLKGKRTHAGGFVWRYV